MSTTRRNFLIKLGAAALSAPAWSHPRDLDGFTCVDSAPPYRYYRKGKGPAVFLLHELPGLCMADIERARAVSEFGFTVFLPHFFGSVGEDHTILNAARLGLLPSAFWASLWFPAHTPRVSEWLKGAIERAYQECGQKGVGVIGMCLTGSLPLTMLQLEIVKAAVLCQPANPAFFQSSLDVSKHDLAKVHERLERDKPRILLTRFSGDGKCSPNRQARLERELRGYLTELIVSSGNPHPLLSSAPHSVLGMDFNAKGYANETREIFQYAMQYMGFRLKDHPDGADLASPPPCTGKLDCKEVK